MLIIDPLTAARSLAPLINAEAAAADAAATMTQPVVDALADAGLFGLLVPRCLDGIEADALTTLAVFEELSRADGSTGWSFLANATTTAFAAAYTGDAAVKAMFGGPGPAIHAGMLGPRGEAKAVEGGFGVHGHFSFGSGSGHAAWIGAGTLVTKDGRFVTSASGVPELRVVFVPREAVQFLGNWDVVGLSGTGSYDYELADQFVDTEWTFPLIAAVPRRGGPVYQLGVLLLTSLGHCGFALGVGRRSLEELAQISTSKQRMGAATTVSEQQMFQHDFAFQDAALRAARAYACPTSSATGFAKRPPMPHGWRLMWFDAPTHGLEPTGYDQALFSAASGTSTLPPSTSSSTTRRSHRPRPYCWTGTHSVTNLLP